jgi:hypothetical protein
LGGEAHHYPLGALPLDQVGDQKISPDLSEHAAEEPEHNPQADRRILGCKATTEAGWRLKGREEQPCEALQQPRQLCIRWFGPRVIVEGDCRAQGCNDRDRQIDLFLGHNGTSRRDHLLGFFELYAELCELKG